MNTVLPCLKRSHCYVSEIVQSLVILQKIDKLYCVCFLSLCAHHDNGLDIKYYLCLSVRTYVRTSHQWCPLFLIRILRKLATLFSTSSMLHIFRSYGPLLTNISLASLLWDIGKQHRPRSDAAERGLWSGSPLLAFRIFYWNLNKIKKYHLTINIHVKCVDSVTRRQHGWAQRGWGAEVQTPWKITSAIGFHRNTH